MWSAYSCNLDDLRPLVRYQPQLSLFRGRLRVLLHLTRENLRQYNLIICSVYEKKYSGTAVPVSPVPSAQLEMAFGTVLQLKNQLFWWIWEILDNITGPSSVLFGGGCCCCVFPAPRSRGAAARAARAKKIRQPSTAIRLFYGYKPYPNQQQDLHLCSLDSRH